MSSTETWKMESETPFGVQESILYFSTAGDTVTGKMEYKKGGEAVIKDAKIEGDTLIWKATRKILTFEFTVKISGDSMSGTVKSRLGKAHVIGTRIKRENISFKR